MKQWAVGLTTILCMTTASALAQQVTDESNDPLVSVVQNYVQHMTAQQETSGRIIVEVMPNAANAGLCQSPCPFVPAGQRMRGNVTVGIKCVNELGHDIPRYYRVHIGIENDYVIATHDLMPGILLTAADIETQHGDITRLPNATFARTAEVVGQRLTRRVPAGMPLHANMVKAPLVITRNSRVTVIARHAGFTITTQGTAMDEAPLDGQLRIRMDSKKIIMAKATAPGEAVAIQ